MLITNIETVPGRTITRHIGLVQGSTVRAKHVVPRHHGRTQKHCRRRTQRLHRAARRSP
ncbi:heavy metal-binding domain-containing protein [Kingella potus]|uniref:heavy metal-binding domain-containing protein n=1 Tax=Kingella potus TaxID=265175 RepID=UPI0024681DC9|nr:heavy metal-binding domain-containing protein [Kingella potus]